MLQASSFSNILLTGGIGGPEPQKAEGDTESVAPGWTVIYRKQQQFLQVCSFSTVF